MSSSEQFHELLKACRDGDAHVVELELAAHPPWLNTKMYCDVCRYILLLYDVDDVDRSRGFLKSGSGSGSGKEDKRGGLKEGERG